MFSALKIAQRSWGKRTCPRTSAATPSHPAPLQSGQHDPRLRPGLASSNAVAPNFSKRLISILGDGGFWHFGLTTGWPRRLQQTGLDPRRPRELLHLGPRAAVQSFDGQEPARRAFRMSIARDDPEPGGVSWLRVVNPYKVADTLATGREAMTTTSRGSRSSSAAASGQLERSGASSPRRRPAPRRQARVVTPRFASTPHVCTGDSPACA